jgi:hypothetical protein
VNHDIASRISADYPSAECRDATRGGVTWIMPDFGSDEPT